MVRLELKPGLAGWKAQTNRLSYGGNLGKINFSASDLKRPQITDLFLI